MRQSVSIHEMPLLTYNKGNALSDLGRPEEAVAAYKRQFSKSRGCPCLQQ